LIDKEVQLEDIATIVKNGFNRGENEKSLPPYLFYDSEGSDLFERICKLPEYYLTRAEYSILLTEADNIAHLFPPDVVLVELGSGSSTKTKVLLEAFLNNNHSLTYIPIDISSSMLKESAEGLLATYPSLSIMGIVGEYQDGVAELRKMLKNQSKLFLWLGSSAGNLSRKETITFFQTIRTQLQNQNEMFLLGLDLQKEVGVLEAAYNDAEGVTAEFNLNILKRINATLHANFNISKFQHHSVYNTIENRIEMYLISTEDQLITISDLDFQIHLKKGERLHTENSYKYSLSEIETLAKESDFMITRQWFDDEKRFCLSLLSPILNDTEYEAQLANKLKKSWTVADLIFNLINEENGGFHQQPISLRHPFIFYLGHLSAFEINQFFNNFLKDPTICSSKNNDFVGFDTIFERGLDPDVDDPTKCHSHSPAPKTWPSVSVIQKYRKYVQELVLSNLGKLLAKSKTGTNVMVSRGRIIHMCVEHTFMHAETLLYMLQILEQKYKVRPSNISYDYRRCPVAESERQPVFIPGGKARMGAGITNIDFGWDNEFPLHIVHVPAFEIDPLPVTNKQYFEFFATGEYNNKVHWLPSDWEWKTSHNHMHPNFWKEKEGKWYVLTLFDEIEFESAAEWPVYVTNAEAFAYTKWKGKRLPTEPEFHRAAYGVKTAANPVEAELSRPYPWGWNAPEAGKHGNFGLVNWNPVPVGIYPEGRSSFGIYDLIGNGWEWTSSKFDPFPGFQPLDIYPGYSADFFDEKHFVLKGASFATDPTLIRSSFRNWFQAHYPYVFAKFRLVRSA